jgi:hypothetical protein
MGKTIRQTSIYSKKPSISVSLKRTIVYISCNATIQVFLKKPLIPSKEPVVRDITDEYTPEHEGKVIVRNRLNHNHIVASYNQEQRCFIIWSNGRKYKVEIPDETKEMWCSGWRIPM